MEGIIETLIAEGKATKLTILGKDFVIRKISAITYFKLAKFIIKTGIKYKQQLANFDSAATDIQDMLAFLEIIDEAELIELISILLGTTDLEFCKEVSGDDVLLLLETSLQYNNFSEMLKNVKRVISKLKNQATTNG